MLQQSLHINYIVARWADLAQDIRNTQGNLLQAETPIALVMFDLMQAVGISMNGIRQVLTEEELTPIGQEPLPDSFPVKCQGCGTEEALHLVKTRKGRLLLCEDCEGKYKKGC